MIDFEKEKSEYRNYLYDNRDRIIELSKSEGDGFVEFRKGMDFKKRGNDKEALVYFYASLMKKYDNPGLYEETARILQRHEMKEEELNVLEKGVMAIKPGTFYYQKMTENIKQLREKLSLE